MISLLCFSKCGGKVGKQVEIEKGSEEWFFFLHNFFSCCVVCGKSNVTKQGR